MIVRGTEYEVPPMRLFRFGGFLGNAVKEGFDLGTANGQMIKSLMVMGSWIDANIRW